jgi:hypothetical protein
MVSPSMSSGSRLVASRWTRGHRRSMASAIFAHASTRCSQLSSRISTSWGPSASSNVSSTGRPGGAAIPSASQMAVGTAPSSESAASSTSHTPSPDPSSSSAAACRLSLVLPAPPAPVSVTRRDDSTRARSCDSSRSRPMNVASCAGRLFGSAGLPSERSGGNSVGRPATSSWKICSGRPRSFSRCVPSSRSAAPGGRASRTRTAAASDSSTWPPWATAATRAARCTSRPTRPVTVFAASPVWTPIRTRTRSPSGHGCDSMACCICATAATQAFGEANTAKNASPWVPASSPP